MTYFTSSSRLIKLTLNWGPLYIRVIEPMDHQIQKPFNSSLMLVVVPWKLEKKGILSGPGMSIKFFF
jgi:hypothetical protein